MAQLRQNVCIIGGGVAGLISALHCKQAGLSFKIFEQNPFIGGLSNFVCNIRFAFLFFFHFEI